ncbi:hypothetical protein BC828DRAFT_420153 [Blastocladiella britannica]|nr:hypothetical protein BC828DRAFT_420153 [Blastocladiella britannica]
MEMQRRPNLTRPFVLPADAAALQWTAVLGYGEDDLRCALVETATQALTAHLSTHPATTGLDDLAALSGCVEHDSPLSAIVHARRLLCDPGFLMDEILAEPVATETLVALADDLALFSHALHEIAGLVSLAAAGLAGCNNDLVLVQSMLEKWAVVQRCCVPILARRPIPVPAPPLAQLIVASNYPEAELAPILSAIDAGQLHRRPDHELSSRASAAWVFLVTQRKWMDDASNNAQLLAFIDSWMGGPIIAIPK